MSNDKLSEQCIDFVDIKKQMKQVIVVGKIH
jgi:hypothetical protein